MVAEVEISTRWPRDVKSQLIGKDSDAEKDWRQKEKLAAEDEMIECIMDSMDVNLSNSGR